MPRQKMWKLDILEPVGGWNRRSGRSITARANTRAATRRRSRSEEEDYYRELYREEARERRRAAGSRHFYGAWTPWGMPASLGGHPGRLLRRAHQHVRMHARRIGRAMGRRR